MLTVELIYDRDCPNIQEARAHLLRAFAETGRGACWQEWDRGSPETPPYVRYYGSPTILVNGHDVAGASPSAGADCCRIYAAYDGKLSGIPSIESIASALVSATQIPSSNPKKAALPTGGWGHVLAVLPALGTPWLPICPACWPAYAGLLSSFGLGFINYGRYLFPLTTAFLILALISLTYQAKARRGYKPLALGMLAAILIIVGKFVWVSDGTLYGGVTLLMGASLWNAWPRRRTTRGSCPAGRQARAV